MDSNLNNLFILTTVNGVVVALLLSWYAFGFGFSLKDQSSGRSLHEGRAITGAGIFMFLPLCISALLVFPEFIFMYLMLGLSILGLADDKFDLSFKLRLLVQVLVMAATLQYFNYEINLLALFLLLAGVWWINLFNFMDGANGMAGFHGLVVVIFYGVVFVQHQSLNFIITSALVILLIYLVFNVILKKLFMGDSGSLPLAFFLVVLALWSLSSGWLSYFQVAIIHAVFIVDATATLLMRLRNGENITQAHASHLYQRLIKAGGSHIKVSAVYAIVTTALCLFAVALTDYSLLTQLTTLAACYLILSVVFMKTLSLGR